MYFAAKIQIFFNLLQALKKKIYLCKEITFNIEQMSTFKRFSMTFGCMLTIIATPMAQTMVPARMSNKVAGSNFVNIVEKNSRPQWAKSIMKTSGATPYIYNIKDGEADIFGQLRYEKNVNGTGLIRLTTYEPNKYKWIHDYGFIAGTTPILTAGTYVGDEYYAFETTYYSNVNMPKAISVVDVNTGEYKAKREIKNSTTERPLVLDEMTYDPKTDKIFGMHYDTDGGISDIYEIDRTTLELKRVASVYALLYTLAADNGTLYAVRMSDKGSTLCKIDESSINESTKSCTLSDIGQGTGINIGDYSQSMEFDKTTHRLWWVAQTESGAAYMAELDTETGKVKGRTLINSELQLLAMAIPYQYVPDAAPSYPRGFNVKAGGNGALTAALSFTTPSLNYRNGSLSSLSGVKVYRNGELVQTIAEMATDKLTTWTDTPTADGYYIYKVVPYNEAGDGVYKEYATFVGEDLPGEPQNVTLSAVGGNATISWTAPTEGQQGGYFDAASLKYDVVRMPDNVTVVSGTSSTTVTDAVTEQKGYSYVVTSVNKKGKGASATSNTLGFGPEGNVPFTSPLTTQADFNRWVADDKNKDGGTWNFYLPTQTTTYDRTDYAADDWLYSPALTFDKNKTYQIRYTYSTANWVNPDDMQPVMEKMKVWLCQEPLTSGNQQLIRETGEFHTASNIYLYGKDNFQPSVSGSARVAFQACSDANRGQIYLKDVSVREYSATDLSVQQMTGSTLVNSNVQQTFTVDVKNEGSDGVADYKVVLLDAETNAVLGEAKGLEVAPDATVEVPVNWIPGAEGTINVLAKVELASDTYPADNVLATPLEVKINPEAADKWLTLNTDNNTAWRYPFWLLDPYSKVQSLFLEKEMQKKNIRITGMRVLYNGKREAEFTFPAKISFKQTNREDVLNAAGDKAEFENGDFATVFDGNLAISGVGDRKELVINFTTPYLYTGGNVCMEFECQLGNNYITNTSEHPEWLVTELSGQSPRSAYCSGNNSQQDVWGAEFVPTLSISYIDETGNGILTLTGDKFGVTRYGNSLLFAQTVDAAQLYSVSGCKLADVRKSDRIDIAGIAKGVYLLKVSGNGIAETLKIAID